MEEAELQEQLLDIPASSNTLPEMDLPEIRKFLCEIFSCVSF